ncbi:MAG: Gfo/Idh/MocA family oxidoreductase [Phycisphaeraceae bacterium]|nr:Gfo/Idh/MocA family oxidoreductase [Phycisphaeraceae bacterium]
MKRVRYGIIGCGAIGTRRHIPECVANPKAQLAAVCDVVLERAQRQAQKHGAEAYSDYRRMLKRDDLDAVVVCGPNYLHAPMSIAALKSGRHVLCEKPMATTRREGKAMIEAAKKARKYLMVGQNQRLMPAHVKAKQILDSGRVGKVLAFRTCFKHPGPETWAVDGMRSWFFNKDQAVMGVTGDLGVHKADLMRWLLGEEFVEVGGTITTIDKRYDNGRMIDVDDNAIISLRSARGVIGSMEVSWTSYGTEDNSTVLYCQKAVMTLGGDPNYGVMVTYKDRTRELHQVGAMASNLKQTSSGMIDTFTDCILKGKAPSIDGKQGYRSMNVILTAMEAAARGRTVKVRN